MAKKVSEIYSKALVTGVSSGLGKAFAKMLLDEGVEVWGTSRNAEKLTKRDNFHPISLDLNDENSILNLVDELSGKEIDLLINNAGAGSFAQWDQFPFDEIDKQSEILMTAPIKLCHHFFPGMRKRNKGAIINISSLAAEFPLPLMPLYNAGKAGLSRFTRSLEMDALDCDVQVVDFQPGDYQTEFNNAMIDTKTVRSDRDQRAWEMYEKHLKMGPKPEHAAQVLRSTLLKKRSGLVTCGTIFQAKIAPTLARLAPWSWVRFVMEFYYRLR